MIDRKRHQTTIFKIAFLVLVLELLLIDLEWDDLIFSRFTNIHILILLCVL